MKKLLLAALFIIGMSSVASAQQKHGYSQTTYITEKRAPKKLAPVEPGYQSTVNISTSFGLGLVAPFLEYIGGYRFNNTLFLGAGVGLGSLEGDAFAYRLHVNGRFYLSKTRLQPFLGAAIGFEGYNNKIGFYAMPEVGMNYRISNRTSAFLSIGYGATLCNSGLQVKVGATF